MIQARYFTSSLSQLTLSIALCMVWSYSWYGSYQALAMCPRHQVTLGIESGTPVALETGLSQGVGTDYLYVLSPRLGGSSQNHQASSSDDQRQSSIRSLCRRRWVWLGGAHIAYRGLEESSRGWLVNHDEWHIWPQIILMRMIGRGSIGLSLGIGGVYVIEEQSRHQARRLALDEIGSTIDVSDISSEARQWVTALSLRPLTQIQLTTYKSGAFGLTSSGEITWRSLPEIRSTQAPSWGWGIHVGIYWSFGGSS
jgi:hypothetical protein